jgi:hypothetical protein
MTLLPWLAALPCLYWTEGAESAPALKAAGAFRLCVPPETTDGWSKAGFSVVPLGPAELASREALPPPGIMLRAERVSATRSPWVFANGWRFKRTPAGKYSYTLPPGKAALAAAEAFAYGADAILRIDPADQQELGRMMDFLARLPPLDAPEIADLGVVDDGSPALGEVMNLLVRRNLLFRVVSAPAPELHVNVRLGTKEYPAKDAADPSALALKVRRRLTDERRTLRIFGSEVVIARLTGQGPRRRLHLLNYGGREIEGLRVRLLGPYPEGEAYAAGGGRLTLEDHLVAEGATEFTLPRLGTYGVVDLPAVN